VPASRSRTNEWRRSLQQVFERGGAIEFAIARPDTDADSDDLHDHAAGADLVWRVKVLKLTDKDMTVEAPMALGRNIDIEPGIELVGAISIGQNRWMFRTRNIGESTPVNSKSRSHRVLRLSLPENVRRCQRRVRRFDTRELKLPEVEVWPLLDPKSVLPAERAVKIAWEESRAGEDVDPDSIRSDAVMPTVGPLFNATLMNLGGGGIGLRVESDASQSIARHRVFWIRMPLPPELDIPVMATGKIVHTHIDSMHRTYAGIAFDFTFNHDHQNIVAEQISVYIERLQATQLRANSRTEPS
jgi:hypothetical protein